MSLSNENRKNKDNKVNAKTTEDMVVESTTQPNEELTGDTSSSSYARATELRRDLQQSQQDISKVSNKILDESKQNIERATEEAKNEIPKFTEAVNSYQHQTLEAARDIANNNINAQREIVNSFQNSWMPYWEKTYALMWDYMSPQRMVEMYTNFVSSFADSSITATRLANNNLLNTMDSFKRNMDQAKQNSDDIARASTNFAKKMERDARNIATQTDETLDELRK